jgi:hypothetical protein
LKEKGRHKMNSIKERYLSVGDFSESTRKKIELAFKMAEQVEEKYSKDLSEFNLEQAKELDMKYRAIYEKYYDWCVEEMLVSVSFNPYEALNHI